MSRSRRHAPYVGHTTAPSDKPWKQQHSRKWRRAVHQSLGAGADGDVLPVSKYAKGAGAWEGCKDGKWRVTDPNSRLLRK